MRHKLSILTLTLSLIVTIIFTSTLSANVGQTFSDVASTHWAGKHIKKMSLRSVVEGYTDNTFQPNRGIKQQEAVAMIVRFLGYQEEAESAKSLEVNENNELYPYIQNVPEWSKGNVLVAARLGLISIASEAGFKPTEDASRAWLAKLLVTAIQKHGSLPSATNSSTFTDNNSIPSWARNEINLAASANIITGYTDGTFKPERTVTRAEMTALLSKAEEFIDASYLKDIVRGRIEVKQDDGLIINVGNNKLEKVSFAESALFYQDTNKISYAQLKTSDEVSAVVNSSNTIVFLDLLDASERKLDELEGKVYVYDPNKQLLTLEDYTQNLSSHKVNSDTVVFKEGKVVSLNELNTYDKVKLVLEEGEVQRIEIVEAYQHQKEAEIISINDKEKVITVKHKDHSYEVISINSRIKLLDQQGEHIAFEQLKQNDVIKVNYNEDVVDSIQIPVSLMNDYTITNVSTRKVTVTKDGSSREYDFDTNAKVLIKGYIEPTTGDLSIGDKVKLNLNNDKIVQIEVTNRERKAYMFDISDATANAIRVKDLKTNASSYITYDSQLVKFYQNNTELKSINSFNQGDRIYVSIRDGKVLRIDKAILNSFEVIAKDETNKTITLKNRQYSGHTFKYSEDTIVNINGTTSFMSNIVIGDDVNVFTVGNDLLEIRK